jgi:hypothetical protein
MKQYNLDHLLDSRKKVALQLVLIEINQYLLHQVRLGRYVSTTAPFLLMLSAIVVTCSLSIVETWLRFTC